MPAGGGGYVPTWLHQSLPLGYSAMTDIALDTPCCVFVLHSQDLVRIAMWSGVQKLDIKFPEHEREWHQVGGAPWWGSG